MSDYLKLSVVVMGMITTGSILFAALLGIDIGLLVFAIVSIYAGLFISGLYVIEKWETK